MSSNDGARRAGASGPLLLLIVWSSKLAVMCSLYQFITANLQRCSLGLLFLGTHYRRCRRAAPYDEAIYGSRDTGSIGGGGGGSLGRNTLLLRD
jgi:hypothetical protein